MSAICAKTPTEWSSGGAVHYTDEAQAGHVAYVALRRAAGERPDICSELWMKATDPAGAAERCPREDERRATHASDTPGVVRVGGSIQNRRWGWQQQRCCVKLSA